MPGIIRVEHRRDPYVVIDRRPLEDARLSWAARGLLGYLLAKPDDWELRVSDLCRRGDLGRDGVHRLLQQLQAFGYLRRKQVRDARGRVAGYDYTALEVPGVVSRTGLQFTGRSWTDWLTGEGGGTVKQSGVGRPDAFTLRHR